MYWLSVNHVIRKVNLHVITFPVLLFQICLGSNAACREYYGTRIHPSVTDIPEADKLNKISNIRSKIECFSHCVAYSKCGMIIYSVSEKVRILRKIKQLPNASSFIDIPPNSIYTMLQAPAAHTDQYYIGSIRDLNKNVFVWQTGEALTYSRWFYPNPSGGNEHCVSIVPKKGFGWNDIPCHNSNIGWQICEIVVL
ncbi:Hypothetical predicted protein [Octopus vulgaris]|uniref:C-type lectin domain-containing protein n=1 Tax=Octopus vulgaris TaxID=6645 RepID=A0AA36AHF9_OCTVU|nr:Hypothetical predicted protein [Octopus vulgaris]